MTRQTWRIANRLKVSNHPLNFFNCYIDLLNLAYVDAYIRIQEAVSVKAVRCISGQETDFLQTLPTKLSYLKSNCNVFEF